MNHNTSKGLVEAYNSIYSKENEFTSTIEDFVDFINESYDVSSLGEECLAELFIMCVCDTEALNEGVERTAMAFGDLAKRLEAARRGASALNVSQQLKTAQKYVKPAQDAASRAPGFLQNIARGFSQRRAEIKAEKAAEKLARGSQPSPIVQKVQQKVGEKLAGAVDPLAKGAAALAIGGVVDQGLLGGVGGKLVRDIATTSRQLGPAYDRLMGRTPQPAPAPAPATPVQLPAGYRMVNGKVEKVKEDIDLIKKHLLDEGYASTEKQAEVIVANMSENWKQSILGDVE